jgi:hypothetical protein
LQSDVDFFFLKTANQLTLLAQFLEAVLATGRSVYQSGPSVLTAIGVFGTRRIQMILSRATSPIELVSKFDFPSLRCYYDGHYLYPTTHSLHDWTTKKCTMKAYQRIKPMRLFAQYWKGFELDQNAQEYLQSTTYGWPVLAEVQRQYEFLIPYLHEGPIEYQNAVLEQKFGLKPIKLDLPITKLKLLLQTETDCGPLFYENSRDVAIFSTFNADKYCSYCQVRGSGTNYKVICAVAIEICKVDFAFTSSNDILSHMVFPEEFHDKRMSPFLEAIAQKLHSKLPPSLKVAKESRFDVDPLTMCYVDGLAANRPQMGCRARVLIQPSHFDVTPKEATLHWHVTEMYTLS